MELICRQWNQFPENVRKNLCDYYIPLVQAEKVKSVVDGIITEYGTSRGNPSTDGISSMKFTEKQWIRFLLRWS